MKYFLIGGAGIFAIHTAKYLLEQKDTELVVCIGRNKQRNSAFTLNVGLDDSRYVYKEAHIAFEYDVLFELFDEYKPDYVINFAALAYATSWHKAFRYYDTNVTAVSRMCEYLSDKTYLKKFLQIGTSELYGSVNVPVDENYDLKPTSPYAVSKLAADLHLITLFNHSKFPMNIIRPCNCYGPGQLLYRIIPKAAFYFLNNLTFPLEGGGEAQKSFMHSRDLARAIHTILIKGKIGEIYNAGVEKPSSMREIIEIIADLMNKNFDKVVKIVEGRATEDKMYWLDSSKMHELGWKPEISLKEGIQDTINWVLENNEKLKDAEKTFTLRA